MLINVGQLLKEHTGASRTYDITDISPQEKDANPSLEGTINLLRTKRGIFITGQIKAKVEETCIRCLQPAICPISFEFEEEVFPQTYSAEHDPDVDYENFIIDNNNILNLGDLLQQYIELNRPLKPLCKSDCSGIQII